MAFADHLPTTEALHHAYIIAGEPEQSYAELVQYLEHDLQVPTRGNPDLYVLESENLSVAQTRELRVRHDRTSFSPGSKRVFVIKTSFMTREAQNALLKTLEEPHADTHFFILLPYADIVLPTLASRVRFVDIRGDASALPESAEFISASPKDRLEKVKEMVKAGDRMQALAFLDSVERQLRGAEGAAVRKAKYAVALRELLAVKGYLRDNAASVKMILEHIAITMPQCSSQTSNQ